MNTKIKLLNVAVIGNHVGNLLLYFSAYRLITQTILYLNKFNKIIEQSKIDLVEEYNLLNEKEFAEVEKYSREKAREYIIILYFGIYGKDIYNKLIRNIINDKSI
jgi:hypothetical protein